MRPLPATKKAYHDLLLATSLAGGFPSAHDVAGMVTCRYRGDNGRACAAGLLIPDDRYAESFEGSSIDELLGEHKPLHDLVLPEGLSALDLGAAQSAHDNTYSQCKREGRKDSRGEYWDHALFVFHITFRGNFADVA